MHTNPSPHSGGNLGTRNWTSRWVLVCPPRNSRARGAGNPLPEGEGRGWGGDPHQRGSSLPDSGFAAPPATQKIMHTRKRHQDMFQDLNRKLQHSEKDKEALGPDSKVWGAGRAFAVGGGLRGSPWGVLSSPSSSHPRVHSLLRPFLKAGLTLTRPRLDPGGARREG